MTNDPLSGSVTGVLTGLVFAGDEVRLDVSFDVARARLVSLIRGGDLLAASRDAYGAGAAGLAPAPGLSRLTAVRSREPVTRGDSMVVVLRWEATGPGGEPFPVLDADLTLAPAGEGSAALRLAAAYRPPSGAPGGQADPEVFSRMAAATVRGFLGRIGTAIAHPDRMAGPPPDAEVS